VYKRECKKSGVEAMIQFANLHGQVDSRSEAGNRDGTFGPGHHLWEFVMLILRRCLLRALSCGNLERSWCRREKHETLRLFRVI